MTESTHSERTRPSGAKGRKPRKPRKPKTTKLQKWARIRTTRQFLLRAGKDVRPWINGAIARASEVGDPPVFDTALFPWIASFDESWRTIQAEADAVLSMRDRMPAVQDISPDHAKIARGEGWRSYFLWGYGYRRERACRRCPETSRLLDTVPGLTTAFFSIMDPGHYLKRHYGPTKAILTWHLPLHVPDHPEDCQIVIDGTPYPWYEGRSFVFDDTYRHEVWNMTSQPRVVLLMHFRRPVRFPGSLVAEGFLRALQASPFVQDGRRNQDAWEDEFERVAAEVEAERREAHG